jgi:dienelactone hydrolase
MRRIITIFWLATALLTACAAQNPEPPAPTATTSPKVTRTARPTQTLITQNTARPTITIAPSATTVPVIEMPGIISPAAMKISFQTPDGITLRGYFYPASRKNAPVVVMMHQHQGNQGLWNQENSGFIPWLQNWRPSDGSLPTPSAAGALPGLNPELTFNVMTFDFRGHGESDGEKPEDFSVYLADARAAYQAARSLPHVDADRIVGIGTSIGADAVINACEQAYCRGAFAISPGSWLGLEYRESIQTLLDAGKPVRCMYAVNDGPSPATCWSSASNDLYKIFAYPGIKHGMTFFVPRKMEADFGKNIIEFLVEATK